MVSFVNKYVEDLALSKILKDTEIKKLCPLSGIAAAPIVSYRYLPAIRSQILNYRQTHEENLDPTSMSCDCSSSDFRDSHHQHIVTGDLNVIGNIELRNLLKKGLNYRDQVPPDKYKTCRAVKDALEAYIKKKSSKASEPEVMFQEWKNAILDKVRQKLDSFPAYAYNAVLTKPQVMAELDRLKDQFVFVPIDKASNNVAVVCKKFYVEVLHGEINSNTYQQSSESVDDIIERHGVFLQQHGIKLHTDNRCLPYLYATTKMHKNPIKFRFITSGRDSSLKQLSVAIGLCLQRGLKIARNHSKYSNFFHRRNDFYVIDSNQDVLDFMFSSNLEPGRKSVSTFDFSTLYTSIPHDQLKCNLRQFVERIFSIKDKKYMVCNLFNKCAYFSDSDNIPKSYIVFNKSNLVECINYLIDNAFVVFNNNVYRQVIGIPMGTNSGPHVANIYLHQYEHEYFRLLFDRGKNDLLARLEFVFRFQDDLISFNDHGLLQDSLCEIYPPVMIVNNTNISACKSNFLDMTISIYQGKFYFSLYDKRNDYDFDVISFPFLDGNIPKGKSYGVFISQLVRYARINCSFSRFIDDVKRLVQKLIQQDFDAAALRKRFQAFIDNHFDVWGKFGTPLSVSLIF